MTNADIAFEPLEDIYPGIARRRKTDPILDEICCDYEDLTALAEPPEATAHDECQNLQNDLRMTMCALREEIRDRLDTPAL